MVIPCIQLQHFVQDSLHTHTNPSSVQPCPATTHDVQGYLSYPRTESSAYPPNSDLASTCAVLRNHPVYGEYASALLARGVSTPQVGWLHLRQTAVSKAVWTALQVESYIPGSITGVHVRRSAMAQGL